MNLDYALYLGTVVILFCALSVAFLRMAPKPVPVKINKDTSP